MKQIQGRTCFKDEKSLNKNLIDLNDGNDCTCVPLNLDIKHSRRMCNKQASVTAERSRLGAFHSQTSPTMTMTFSSGPKTCAMKY